VINASTVRIYGHGVGMCQRGAQGFANSGLTWQQILNRFYTSIVIEGSTSTSPNLTPYIPSGWSDKIVVSKTTGTTTDSSPLYTTNTLYVDWAVVNNGTAATAARFYTELYVDGMLKYSWFTDPPMNTGSGSDAAVFDYSIGSLSAGTHTMKVKTDSTGTIAESDEGDNEYTKTIIVNAPAQSGSLSVTISPAGAVSAGALWEVDGGAWHSSGTTVSGLSVGSHTVAFNTVSGWNSPASQNVTISNGSTTSAAGTYTPVALPNLTPYIPSGWSDKIVVSKTTGTTTDSSPLYTTNITANQTTTATGTYVIVPKPNLGSSKQGANMVFSWLASATGFVLQSSPNLGSAAVWSTVSPSPVVVGGQNVVTNPMSGSRMFFRLMHP
jgi:hypothetical protein